MKKEFLILIVVLVLMFIGTLSMHNDCKSKGGIPVGYGGMDCYDNTNKIFIN